MSKRPTKKTLQTILTLYDVKPKPLCFIADEAYKAGRLSRTQAEAAKAFFMSLLQPGALSLSSWLRRKGIGSEKYTERKYNEMLNAHRRAWLVKMIEGEI